MPDLLTVIVVLAAVMTVVSALIWNLDRFRNQGADPLVNPAWTVLVRPSQRRTRKKTPPRDAEPTDEGTGPGSATP